MTYSDPAKQREAQAAYQKRKKAHCKKYVQDIKSSTPCSDCGEQYPFYVMHFDHVTPGKKNNVSRLVASGWLAAVRRELELCEVVCANCHAERTYSRIIAVGQATDQAS